MKLYIDGPPGGGEGCYKLWTEQGEPLASHFCSNASFARGDLEARRPERQQEWRERFGDYSVAFVSGIVIDGGAETITHDELVRRAWRYDHDQGADDHDRARCMFCHEPAGATPEGGTPQ